jgi:hypothetical protein
MTKVSREAVESRYVSFCQYILQLLLQQLPVVRRMSVEELDQILDLVGTVLRDSLAFLGVGQSKIFALK